MIKRFFAGVLCVVLVFGVMCGCADGSDKKDLEKIEAQIKEDIVGLWKFDSDYYVFSENGEAGVVSEAHSVVATATYRVEGDTVIISEGGEDVIVFRSVEIDSGILKFSNDKGTQLTMTVASQEEIKAAVDRIN